MTNKSIDILCVGESLIDFIGLQPEQPISRIKDYHRYLGGSPTNVAMNMARLGLKAYMVATVGDDGFGSYILNRLQEHFVNVDQVKKTNEAPTTVIFVSRTTSTPEFIPMRGADALISADQLSEEIIARTKVFHTSCFALSQQPARDTILKAAEQAHRLKCLISIDVNYSEKIWANPEDARKAIAHYCSYEPLVKVSQDDIDRLFGANKSHQEIFDHLHQLGAQKVCLTLGKQGAKLSVKGHDTLELSALKVDKILDATGAGDAFWSGFLFGQLKGKPDRQSMEAALHMAAIKLQNVGRIPDISKTIWDVLEH